MEIFKVICIISTVLPVATHSYVISEDHLIVCEGRTLTMSCPENGLLSITYLGLMTTSDTEQDGSENCHSKMQCRRIIHSAEDLGLSPEQKYLYKWILHRCNGKRSCDQNSTIPEWWQLTNENPECGDGQTQYVIGILVGAQCRAGEVVNTASPPPVTTPYTRAPIVPYQSIALKTCQGKAIPQEVCKNPQTVYNVRSVTMYATSNQTNIQRLEDGVCDGEELCWKTIDSSWDKGLTPEQMYLYRWILHRCNGKRSCDQNSTIPEWWQLTDKNPECGNNQTQYLVRVLINATCVTDSPGLIVTAPRETTPKTTPTTTTHSTQSIGDTDMEEDGYINKAAASLNCDRVFKLLTISVTSLIYYIYM